MSFRIETIPTFDKQAKRLAGKYTSLKTDLAGLVKVLAENPDKGVAIGNDCYKIRMAIASKKKGKSGGARVIYYARISKELIVLLSIYDKGEQETISDDTLIRLLGTIR